MATERAGERHEAVAQKAVAEVACRLPPRRGDRVALHVVRHRNWARGAPPCANRSRPCHSSSNRVPWRRSVIPALRILPRRRTARCTALPRATGQSSARRAPTAPRDAGASMTARAACAARRAWSRATAQCAARHQPAHAARANDELRDRHRPGRDKRLEHLGQCPAVGREVQAGVVMQIDGRELQVASERHAAVMSIAVPLPVVDAQAVDQHDDLSGRQLIGRCEPLPRQLKRLAIPAQTHRDRERIPGRIEVVAQHAVQRCNQGFAPTR